MDIRQVIRHTMADIGLSQTELARQAGMTQPRLSDFLRGKRDIRVETLTRILAALRLEVRPTNMEESDGIDHT